MNIEPLESRIAPATIIALTDSDQLLRFNSASPDSITASVPILGLGATEDVEGIDFRPANGLLYGVAVDGTTARLLTIDPLTGATAQIGATFAVTGSDFGVDFNPVADRLRVVSNTDLNLSINPNTGVATTQTSLNPGNPNVVGAAYTNSFPGTSSTSLFAIDSGSDTLATIAPPSAGTLTNVGALGVGDVTAATGFDIGQGTGESFAALTVGATTQLYSINLTTGAATALGNINAGTVSMRGLAVLQNTWDGSESATLDDPDNWVAGIAPVAGDSLLFPVGPTQLSVKSFYAANTAFNTVRFTGAGYSLSSEFANKITGGIRANFASGTTKVDGTNLLLSSPDGIAPGIVEVAQSGATLDFFQLKIATNLGVDFIGTGNVKIGTLGFETPIGGGDVRVQGAHVTLTGVLHSARTAHVQSGSLELLGFDFFG